MKSNELALSSLFALRTSWIRLLFTLSVVWGVALFWIAPHLPMVDLPQHAAQVALLKDIVLGQSPWSESLRINPLTPYLLGYGLALPLAFLMPVATALKLLLSVAYLAFVALCVKLREHFGGDARLDWLFLVSFFGFAYKWGFLTFLGAAPVALWFVWLADRFAAERSRSLALRLVGVGILLLASHGLMFLFAQCVGLALLASRLPRGRELWRALQPYAVLVVACAAYYLVNLQMNAGMENNATSVTRWDGGLLRIPKVIAYSVIASPDEEPVFQPAAAAFALLSIPWLLGLRIDWRHRSSWIPFATLLVGLALAPSFAIESSFLYQRFALFLLPTYAWMFTRSEPTPAAGGGKPWLRSPLPLTLLILVCWSILGLHTVRTLRFAQESSEIDAILGSLEPGQRALTLMFFPDSRADNQVKVYLHYPAWYQAERHGFVDFNFAWLPPQIVRFRPESAPAVEPGFEWHPERFDWATHRGDQYRYFIARHSRPLPATLFAGAACPPKVLISRGYWTVFERCGNGAS